MTKADAADAWLRLLRERFVAVAGRRVPSEAVEDVVQDALRVIVEKGEVAGSDPARRPTLAWCFQVLRNTIGNFYQKSRTREAWRRRAASGEGPAPAPTPLDALASDDAARAILESIDRLRASDAGCGRYLSRLAAGTTPAELAEAERLDPAVLYRRVYRCRHKLRSLLLERGIVA